MPDTFLIIKRKAATDPLLDTAVHTVMQAGIDLRVIIPWNQKDSQRIIQELITQGAKRIIVGGGDGTLNAFVNTVLKNTELNQDVELGILPLGTANDFARGCGLPLQDLTRCLTIACTHQAHRIDVGKVNDDYFINVTSGGFGAEITAGTPAPVKKLLGGGAYTLMGLLKAINLTPYSGTLHIPGETPLPGSMLFMAVGNNRFAGGGFDVAPMAKLDDGLLDLTAIRGDASLDFIRLGKELEDPINANNQLVFYRQLAAFKIESGQQLQCNLDGEPLMNTTFNFSMLPHCINVVY